MQAAPKISAEVETERFWSKASAERNAAKLRERGYRAEAKRVWFADGTNDWCVRSWWEG